MSARTRLVGKTHILTLFGAISGNVFPGPRKIQKLIIFADVPLIARDTLKYGTKFLTKLYDQPQSCLEAKQRPTLLRPTSKVVFRTNIQSSRRLEAKKHYVINVKSRLD